MNAELSLSRQTYTSVNIAGAVCARYSYDACKYIFHELKLVEQHFLQVCYTIIVKACYIHRTVS